MILAEVANTLDPYIVLANYGVLGCLALGLLTGRVIPAKQYEQCIADRDREHAELANLRQRTEEQIIPAMIRNTDLLTRLLKEP